MTDELAAAILEELRRIRQALESEPEDGLLTAAEVAQRFGVARDWVYANADLLGVIRLPSPTGQRPRLRFDASKVSEALADAEPQPYQPRQSIQLLPVGGAK